MCCGEYGDENAGQFCRERFPDLQVDYETRPELICGVELRLHGQKLAWNLEDYLETFEGEMRKTLEGYALEGQNAEQSNPDQQKTRGS